MPVYEFECVSCGNREGYLMDINDATIPKCIKCGSTTKKIISKSNFVLKGSGWYADGYSSKKEK